MRPLRPGHSRSQRRGRAAARRRCDSAGGPGESSLRRDHTISDIGAKPWIKFYTLGIDIGSTASKCVILADGKELVSKSLIPVGAGTSGPQRAISDVLENAGLKREDMGYVLATGYGRNSMLEIADQQMSELSCHARGASFLFPEVHTVIDIGGQDVKVLQIENGS